MAKTPMMQQYDAAKAACGDAVLLFRMGDFYELFDDDAKRAAPVLGLTLTSRDKGENPIPMAGFPHHQLDGYLGKLISAGFRAAVCEQVEDPKQAQGIVKREVTRIVTPGTLTDDALLDPRSNNYLAAVAVWPEKKNNGQGVTGIAWADVSTGQFFAACFPKSQLADQFARIDPVECLVAEGEVPPVSAELNLWTHRPAWAFSADAAEKSLSRHFGAKSLEGFGFGESDGPAVAAAGAILDYLQETQKASLDHFDRLIRYSPHDYLEIDEASRRSLEITATLREGKRQGSLLSVLDRTVTALGSRQLRSWVAHPLTQTAMIESRLAAVEELVQQTRTRASLREELREVSDMERLLARVSTRRAGPRDLHQIGITLGKLPQIKELLGSCQSDLLNQLHDEIDLCEDVRGRVEKAFAEPCPVYPRDPGFLRKGFHQELDRLRDLAAGGKEWIAKYQAEEASASGIPGLKVGYNKVFGYFLEVTNTNKSKVPEHFIRKQTLKNAERYVTPQLKEYEEKVLAADEQAAELEQQLFLAMREDVAAQARRLAATAAALAKIDALAGLAEIAVARNYCKPELSEEPLLEIEAGRHPVLDVNTPSGEFVPNDCFAGEEAGRVLLITGPNMAGKSTYIRQVALIALMAQMGSFVPAKKATIGVADRIFARVGASDELSRGQSTFMVEMTETARILNTATPRSLVVLDEIGRGTSTYDGISLAWAIVEHLHGAIGCRTLFATHYHELTDLAGSLAGVKNLNVAVKEWEENVVFLHKIVPGAADKSYGIHVSRLAGVPREVNERAKQILAQLEQEHLDDQGRPRLTAKNKRGGDIQLTLFGPSDPLLDEIRELDINSLTPLDALSLISQWQKKLQ